VDPSETPPRVAFVNGGILGVSAYAHWLRTTFPDDREIHAEHFVLTEGMTFRERAIRRVMCQRLWPDPRGYFNLDLARFRHELHSGLQARRRLLTRGLGHFDVLHFHRQATAYDSLDLMDQRPSIVSIDCTQSCALQDLTGRLERRSLALNIRQDGEIFRRAAAIVSTSRWAKDELHRAYPGCTAPCQVLYPPVMMDWFDVAWIDGRRARAAAGAVPRVLFIGGDFPRKGGYDLLRAWTAGAFHGRAELTIVTDWPVEGPVPLGVRIVRGVHSHTSAWAAEWRAADIFVMPTRSEAFGLVYQEAAAAGIPAIGSDLNAVPEIIEDGHTGLLVGPKDESALIRALERLIASPTERYDMGRAGRAIVEQRASTSTHRLRLVDLIRSVCRGPAEGRRRS
jgi:starch synthase